MVPLRRISRLHLTGETLGRFKEFATDSAVFAGVFAFCLFFAFDFRSFYLDDNVVVTSPLLADAARQVLSGALPLRTEYLGGGGGAPMASVLQPGVLNPFGLIPAMLLYHDPELMVNVIVSIHLALFALGGRALGAALSAPAWAGLVAAFSLGFSGYMWVWAATWM
ncbi:MAG: hypothetical protein V2B18_14925, partial [Pseudomonadota bacterium]